VAVLVAGCEVGPDPDDSVHPAGLFGLEVTSLVATSMEIRWQSDEPTGCRLRYGVESIKENTALCDPEPGTEHRVELHLLRPATEYSFRIELLADGALVATETGTFTTADVPDELPDFTVEVDELEDHDFIALTMLGDVTAVVVVSQRGYYAWWRLEDDPELTLARARFGGDGQGVIYSAYDRGERVGSDAVYTIRRSGFGDVDEEAIEVPNHHHDFVELADGTIGWIRSEYREVDDESIRGDAIMETAPDGAVTVRWSSWDHLEFDMSEVCNDSNGGFWTHANALHYDGESDTYLVSMRELDSVVAVDRGSGETLWQLGGCASDFSVPSPVRFDGQHQIEPVDGGVLVYDNQLSGSHSRVVELALDHDAGLAEERWSYAADGAFSTNVLGDVHRLDSGDTLVTWSTAGTLEQVDPAQQIRWKGSFGFGTVLGYGELMHGEAH